MTKRLSSTISATSAPPTAPLDDTDRALLSALAEDARLPVSELARGVGLSAPATADRLRRLEASGVIERFTVRIDRARSGIRCRRSSGSSRCPASCIWSKR
jgi:Lrp/AsnC family transcriptional regulator, leucine-responsive regulatory protein